MSALGLLAAASALLLVCAVRELLASQPARGASLLGVEDRLARAGLRERITPAGVLILRGVGAIFGLFVAPIAAPAAPGRLSWFVLIAMPAAGFLSPDALLERAARRRHDRLIAALPDALDLMAVSAATGRR